MGISLHITAISEGTAARSLQYLCEERVTGHFSLSFGRNFPLIVITLRMGAILAAEFGELRGMPVFDLIACQESAFTELVFHPGRESNVEQDDQLLSMNPKTIFAGLALQVEKCAARPFIYGKANVRIPGVDEPIELVKMIHGFAEYKELLEKK